MRVNVGCGATPTAGWINLDNSFSVRAAQWPILADALTRARLLSAPSRDLARMASDRHIRYANAAVRMPFADQSLDAVYSSHMIEHLDRTEARGFLHEVRRVLRPGGVVRIAAPDLERLAQDYLATGDADDFISGIHMGLTRPAGQLAKARWALIGPRHHLWMYDGASLSKLVGSAGFASVSVMPPGKTNITDPGRLDLEERAHESVYVEGIQPV